MKLPRFIHICGKKFRTRRLPKSSKNEGTIDLNEEVISVMRAGSDQDHWEVLMHEVTEGAMALMGLEYECTAGEHVLFVMTHQQMQNLVSNVAGALFPIAKKGIES